MIVIAVYDPLGATKNTPQEVYEAIISVDLFIIFWAA